MLKYNIATGKAAVLWLNKKFNCIVPEMAMCTAMAIRAEVNKKPMALLVFHQGAHGEKFMKEKICAAAEEILREHPDAKFYTHAVQHGPNYSISERDKDEILWNTKDFTRHSDTCDAAVHHAHSSIKIEHSIKTSSALSEYAPAEGAMTGRMIIDGDGIGNFKVTKGTKSKMCQIL